MKRRAVSHKVLDRTLVPPGEHVPRPTGRPLSRTPLSDEVQIVRNILAYPVQGHSVHRTGSVVPHKLTLRVPPHRSSDVAELWIPPHERPAKSPRVIEAPNHYPSAVLLDYNHRMMRCIAIPQEQYIADRNYVHPTRSHTDVPHLVDVLSHPLPRELPRVSFPILFGPLPNRIPS